MKNVTSARTAKTHAIPVSVTGNGTIRCKDQFAKRGDKVTWTSSDGPFTIQFLGGTPFARQHIHSRRGSIRAVRIPKKAKPGRYPYAIAVEKNGKVYLDARCPEIIIEL